MSAKTNKKLKAIAKTLPKIDRANPVYISYSRSVAGSHLIDSGTSTIKIKGVKTEVKKNKHYITEPETTTSSMVDHYKEVKRCYDIGGMKAVEAYCDNVYKIAREKKPKPEPTVI